MCVGVGVGGWYICVSYIFSWNVKQGGGGGGGLSETDSDELVYC